MAKKYLMALAAQPLIKDQSLLRHEEIKRHIRILPELAAYIPPLLPDEYNQLVNNIKQNGCREALLVWETTAEQLPGLTESGAVYVLIDGHNRYTICQQYQLDFKVHLMQFSTLEQVKFFMIDNQLGRRNLSPEQVSYLRGIRYLNEKKSKGQYLREEHKGHFDPYALSDSTDSSKTKNLGQEHKGQNDLYGLSESTSSPKAKFLVEEHKGQNDPYGLVESTDSPQTKFLEEEHKGHFDPYALPQEATITSNESLGVDDPRETTARRLGKRFNVSEKTIKRDGAYAAGLERLAPEFKQDILSGKQKVDKGLIQQLGQLKKYPLKSAIQSQVELEQFIRGATSKPTSEDRGEELRPATQVAQLTQQLQELVLQLTFPGADLPLICGNIISSARQLQKSKS